LSFSNPWGLLALLLIIPIVLLYILKKQHEDRTISSTMLWQQVVRDLQATRPWQRLRTRLLLILQILAVILFAVSLARPTWYGGSEGGVHYIAVMDTSARMQARDVKPSRMEAARNALLDFIQSMKPGDTLTLVQAGQQPFVIAGPSGNKGALKQAVSEIQPANGRADLIGAVQLAQTLLRDQSENNGRIHVYSDHFPSGLENQDNLVFHIASGNGQNAAVTHVGYEIGNESISVLSRVANYGLQRNITLELKIDGELQNVKDVHLPAGEEVNVYWSGIPTYAREIMVSISEEDDLMLDNIGMAAVSEEYQAKVLMATERNVYLERALSLREDIDLYKVNPDQTPESTDFHLYIYDCRLPEQLPEDGHIIAFSPSSHEQIGLAVEGEIRPVIATANTHARSFYPSLLQYVEPEGYQIARAGKMNVPEGFTVLLQDEGENPLLIAGEQEGRKIALFAFSLHESNLPLKADFPILVQNLLNWLLPPDIAFAGQIFAGESLQLECFPNVSRIIVTSPSGRKYDFDAYPAPVFYDTHDIGIYKISQQAGDQTYTGSFVVSVPTHEVSDLCTGSEVYTGKGGGIFEAAASPFGKDIWMTAGWTLLLLLLIEWQVYHHGT
jgi:Ca-activated chloride channel family protein